MKVETTVLIVYFSCSIDVSAATLFVLHMWSLLALLTNTLNENVRNNVFIQFFLSLTYHVQFKGNEIGLKRKSGNITPNI